MRQRRVSCSTTLSSPNTVGLSYSRSVVVHKPGPEEEAYFVSLPSPVLQQERTASKYHISLCVLPGVASDYTKKTCQDTAFFETYSEDLLFAGVFDGHGSMGKAAACFCADFFKTYAADHLADMRSTPEFFLKIAILKCNVQMNKPDSGIDCQFSGTTATMVLVVGKVAYFANVGDSRTVLGTSALNSDNNKPQSVLPKIPSLVTAVQVTKDHKPEDPVEAARITAAGGIISQSIGDPNGPMRVWKLEGMYPGIGMSRSIGDEVAHSIGVSCEADVTRRELHSASDLFIVLASDGVWDFMKPQEVCDFVDVYRKSPRSAEDSLDSPDLITEQNSSTSRLLCEEARHRWVPSLSAKEGGIDDITCLIIKFL